MDAIITALGYLIDPVYWVVLLSVVFLAALASAIPGMNAFLVMALAFPFILFEVEEPAIGLVALATISGVSNTLDSVPAILIGQPSAATQVTFLEGHQLARRGRAAHTLGAVYAVSALGGIVGAVLLTIAIPVARPFVLRFGFPEIAATGMVGIAMVIVLSRGAMVRGLIAALVGMLLGIIGSMGRLTVDPFVSMPLVPFIIGLFALPELVDLMMSRRPVAAEGANFGEERGVARGGLRAIPLEDDGAAVRIRRFPGGDPRSRLRRGWTGWLTRSASSSRKTVQSSARVPWTACYSRSPPRTRRRRARRCPRWRSAFPALRHGRSLWWP